MKLRIAPVLPSLLRALPLAAALGLGAGPGLAGEVEIAYRFDPSGDADSFTFLDVGNGPLPVLSVEAPSGEPYRVMLEINDAAEDKVNVLGKVYSVKAKKKGEVLKEVATLKASTSDGQPTTLRMGLGKGGGAIELDVTPRLGVVTLRRKAADDLGQASVGGPAPTSAKPQAGGEEAAPDEAAPAEAAPAEAPPAEAPPAEAPPAESSPEG